jgi:hypothetical protein
MKKDPNLELLLELERTKAKSERLGAKRRYKTALERIVTLEEQVAALLKLTETPQEYVIKPRLSVGKSEATAFVLASDWHVEERVKAEWVNGLNEFTLTVAERRIQLYFQNALRLIQLYAKDTEITTVVLALLGDFISGNLREENLETARLQPVAAIIWVQERLLGGIKFLLDNTEAKLVIPCHVGNHSRITDKVHASTEVGNSLEFALYQALETHFHGNSRVQFMIAQGYHTYLQVYDWTFRLHHGHGFKYMGGVGGVDIPARRAALQWDRNRKADFDVFGHWHQQGLDKANLVTNGSLIGFSPYGIRIGIGFEPPKQGFFLVHKNFGKTQTANIWLSEKK